MAVIHPTAIVSPQAQISSDAEIGPYTVVEAGAVVGEGSVIGAHVTLGAGLRLGRDVRVFNYACLGTASQDLKHRGEPSTAEIGDGAIIREFATVNRGTRAGSVTRVGPRAVLMAYSHVAHECTVGEGAVLVNGATLGGEVEIGAGAVIGGLCGIHQFCRIGALAIIGSSSKVTQDIGPYLVADGHPARPHGPNRVGLRRAGWSEAELLEVRRIYRELFASGLMLAAACARIAVGFSGSDHARTILAFMAQSRRGMARPRRRHIATRPGELDWE